MHCFLTEHLFLPRYLAKCQRFPEKEVIAPASGGSQSLNGHISKPLPSSAMVEKERKKQQQQKKQEYWHLAQEGYWSGPVNQGRGPGDDSTWPRSEWMCLCPKAQRTPERYALLGSWARRWVRWKSRDCEGTPADEVKKDRRGRVHA